jgi:hypothetical protein
VTWAASPSGARPLKALADGDRRTMQNIFKSRGHWYQWHYFLFFIVTLATCLPRDNIDIKSHTINQNIPYTQEGEWQIRYELGEWRITSLFASLKIYEIFHGEYPEDFIELENSGFFPIRPIDPTTGQSFNFGVTPTNDSDFLNLALNTSSDEWIITYNSPTLPDGDYEKFTISILDRYFDNSWDEFSTYNTVESLRGAILASYLNGYMLNLFVLQHSILPYTTEELFDNLWEVDNDWAQYDDSVSIEDNSIFIFGIDPTNECTIAIWKDCEGILYSDVNKYDPWPNQRTDSQESLESMEDTIESNCESWDDFYDNHSIDFMPEIVLWECRL